MPHLRSDRQRKAMFANMNSNKERGASSDVSDRCDRVLRSKIRKNVQEGRPPKQAVAIGFSQARKEGCKFPKKPKRSRSRFDVARDEQEAGIIK